MYQNLSVRDNKKTCGFLWLNRKKWLPKMDICNYKKREQKKLKTNSSAKTDRLGGGWWSLRGPWRYPSLPRMQRSSGQHENLQWLSSARLLEFFLLPSSACCIFVVSFIACMCISNVSHFKYSECGKDVNTVEIRKYSISRDFTISGNNDQAIKQF